MFVKFLVSENMISVLFYFVFFFFYFFFFFVDSFFPLLLSLEVFLAITERFFNHKNINKTQIENLCWKIMFKSILRIFGIDVSKTVLTRPKKLNVPIKRCTRNIIFVVHQTEVEILNEILLAKISNLHFSLSAFVNIFCPDCNKGSLYNENEKLSSRLI